MYRLIRILQEVCAKYPQNATAQTTLSRCHTLPSDRAQHPQASWDIIRQNISQLEAEGLWKNDAENDALLEQVRIELRGGSNSPAAFDTNSSDSSLSPSKQTPSEIGSKISIISQPLVPATLRPLATTTWLPTELLDVLNQTYFLHILATDAEKVLPPGKSLLSVMSRTSTLNEQGNKPTLQSRVEDLVYKAFWDEALESLSSPTPSEQLPRLKRLYEYLHSVLVSLLPNGHPVLVSLSSPLSPTSAPLQSAVAHLHEILSSLKERCAPFRDPDIDALMQRIEDPPAVELPHIVVDTIRDILKLAETMKEDLSQFVLGNTGEAQLQGVIRAQALERERELVTRLWGSEMISAAWSGWIRKLDETASLSQLSAVPSGMKWIARLIQSLGSFSAVSCHLPLTLSHSGAFPPEQPNPLPPPFFFVAPMLLNIQNYLQALVIAATLRSLVRLPPPPSSPTLSPDSTALTHNFMDRIWTLLSDEIDQEPGDTKLINLADEIIRVRRNIGGIGPDDEETRLRAAVDRTLQPTDPVFQLLQKRLLRAFTDRLTAVAVAENSDLAAPLHLQSGRGQKRDRKPNFVVDLPDTRSPSTSREPPLAVKGYEDAVLTSAITREVERLRRCINWTREVWQDVVEHV